MCVCPELPYNICSLISLSGDVSGRLRHKAPSQANIALDIVNYLKPIYVARTQTVHDPLMRVHALVMYYLCCCCCCYYCCRYYLSTVNLRAQILLGHGANKNCLDKNQETPLHLAANNVGLLFVGDSFKLYTHTHTHTHQRHAPYMHALLYRDTRR